MKRFQLLVTGNDWTDLIALGLALLVVCQVLALLITSSGRSTDFAAFYRAAEVPRAKLYDPRAQDQAVTPEMPNIGHAYYFYHLPFEMPLFWPLAKLPYRTAFLFWTLVNIALLVLAAFKLRSEFPRMPLYLLALLVFAFLPTLTFVWFGQDSAWLLLLFILAFGCFCRGSDWTCGVLLALALIKYQYAIPIILLIAFRKRWRIVAAFSAVAIALLAASWLVVGTQGALDYWHLIQVHGVEQSTRMISIRGLFDLLHLPPVVTIAASVCLLIWFSRRKLDDQSYFVGAVLVAFLVSYHSGDAVLLLLPLFATLEQGKRWPLVFWLMLPFAALIGTKFLCLWALPAALLLPINWSDLAQDFQVSIQEGERAAAGR